MIDPKLALALLAALGIYYGAIKAWHGIAKVGHGAKVVACKLHVAHCTDDKDTRQE